jgi:hypothetical protein
MAPIDKVKDCIARITDEFGKSDAIEIITVTRYLLQPQAAKIRKVSTDIASRIEDATWNVSPAVLDAALEVIKRRAVAQLDTKTGYEGDGT